MYANPEDVALPELDNNHDKGLSVMVASAMMSNFLCSMIAWDYIPYHHRLQALQLAALGRHVVNSKPGYPAIAGSA